MGITTRTALFLGAGASKALGYPLTREIFPQIRERLAKGDLFARNNVVVALQHEHAQANAVGFLGDAMNVLRTELETLLPGVWVTTDPPGITQVLSLLDHLILSGSSAIPHFPRERLARVRSLLERAVATVVTAPDEARNKEQLALVQRLVSWIAAETKRPRGDRHLITVITTNYDLAVEKPLRAALGDTEGQANRIDYGFTWRNPFELEGNEEAVCLRPVDADIAFYKLHGSINWLRCPLCEYVYINGLGEIFHQAYASRVRPENTCTCGHWPLGTLLVAPSMVRDIRDPNLLSIWQSALEALRRSERWVVVGYSLPPEDLAIGSLFLRASRARQNPAQVELYDQGPQPEMVARYRLLLENVKYSAGGFTGFIDTLPVAAAAR